MIFVVALAMGISLSGIPLTFGQPTPPIKEAPKPTAPVAALKIDTAIRSHLPLAPDVQSKLLGISRELVTQNLSAELARGLSSRAETNVLRQTPKVYVAENIVLNLLKETYTAEMSRIEFSYGDGKTNIIRMDKVYQPKVAEIPREVAADARLEGEKQKLNVFKAREVPDHPSKFNFGLAIKEAEEAERREGPRSWWRARGLANTPCTEFPSAVSATSNIHGIMNTRFGGSAAKRIGTQSSKAEIMDFLKNDNYLLAWNNIGHGVTGAHGTPCYGLV